MWDVRGVEPGWSEADDVDIPAQRGGAGGRSPHVRIVYGSPMELYDVLKEVEAEGLIIRSVVRGADGGWRVRVDPRKE
jgi:hypothetical protein